MQSFHQKEFSRNLKLKKVFRYFVQISCAQDFNQKTVKVKKKMLKKVEDCIRVAVKCIQCFPTYTGIYWEKFNGNIFKRIFKS